jgi:DNA modification methylase
MPGSTYSVPRKFLVDNQYRLTENVDFMKERVPTFFDSWRSPVHRWYGIVPGFSYASVAKSLVEEGMTSSNKLVLDPFAGSGTTVVTAKAMGITSIGVEAHPLLALAAKTKTFWDFKNYDLNLEFGSFMSSVKDVVSHSGQIDTTIMPEFVTKLYDAETLRQLLSVRGLISDIENEHLRSLYTLALIRALKQTTFSKVDGIYLAPESKKKSRKGVVEALAQNLSVMFSDLTLVQQLEYADSMIILGDARRMLGIEDSAIDFAYTSPPYLNNFDYAEMTRLELYFLGMAKSWKEITRTVREKLLTNTTTQVSPEQRAGLRIEEEMPVHVRAFVEESQKRLYRARNVKSGKKDYDIILVKYFNEMHRHFKEMVRVLKPGARYVMTLGDSALYGVHIPTDELLRDVALGAGFRAADIEMLRARGNRSNIDKAKRPRTVLREVRLHLLR